MNFIKNQMMALTLHSYRSAKSHMLCMVISVLLATFFSTSTLAEAAPIEPDMCSPELPVPLEPDQCPPDEQPTIFNDASEAAGTNVPATMNAGQSYTVTVKMLNTGGLDWNSAGAYKLGSNNPLGNSIWGRNRVELAASTAIGGTATFTFNVTAPNTPGSYNFQWRMVQDGVAWFGAPTQNKVVTVVASNIIGYIDGIYSGGEKLHGWACSRGLEQQVTVHLYLGGPVGTGTFYGSYAANSASEPAVAQACGNNGTAYRFYIPITTEMRNAFGDEGMYVHGISPVGQANNLLTNSGIFFVPVSTAEIPMPPAPSATMYSVSRNYVYDEKQRLCKTIEPETRASIYDYDGAGNMLWSASGQDLMGNTCDRPSVPASAKTVYTYDAMSRVTSVTYPDGINNTTSTYEADGKLKTVISNGSTWSFEYNKRRLLTKETLSFYSDYVNSYGYNANGHLASVLSPNSTVIDYAPNALGQPTQASGYASNVQYHPNGTMKQFTYGNGIKYSMTPNMRQLPDITSYKLGTAKIAEFDLNFDPNGNVLNNLDLAQAGRTDRSMAYDGLDRLIQVYAPNMWGMANYQYDVLDNLRRSTLGLAGFTYLYDANNRVQRIDRDASGSYAYTFDTRGNVLSDGRNNYTFTQADRLAGVTGKETYQYDGFGRRVVSWRQDGTSTVPVYSQDGVLRYDADNKKGGGTTHVQLNGSQIAEHFKKWSDGAVTITYTLTDSLGSPIATTDTAGGVLNRTEYAPFGAPFNRPVDGVGYTGHVMDQGTGLVYAQQRYYDPMIGRFLSADPMASDMNNGWNFNRYNYAANNPYKFTDPDGRSIWTRLYKLAKNGGDLALTFEGVRQDAKALNKSNNFGVRVLYGLSIASEIAPVSVGDAKDAYRAISAAVDAKSTSNSADTGKLYHYTDAQGAEGIAKTGVINSNSKGQVFVTDQKLSPEEVKNRLFVGNSGEKGSHVVEIKPVDGLPVRQGKNGNEMIHTGAIRDGRHGTLEVKKND